MPLLSTAAAASVVLAATFAPEVTLADPSAMTLLGNATTLALGSLDNVTSSSSYAGVGVVDVSSCVFNATANATVCTPGPTTETPSSALPHSIWVTVVLGLLAGVVSLMTILGNITVLLAFGLERTIRQPTNYFLASLAVSDLLIGTFSMPLYTQYLLWGVWPLGPWLCDLWLSLDWTVCLTSQYTVFLITMDRFLSVKIPARYRNWRTEHKVLIMISVTWILPALVFFTSIIGWQYFVGKRTVGEKVCEVQFMNDAMFIFLLTIGYFWITLFVIGILYGGIYKVALDLQRKSDAKHKKLQTTMELAAEGPNNQTGGSGNNSTACRNVARTTGDGSNNNSSCEDSNVPNQNNKNNRAAKNAVNNRKSVRAALPCPAGAQVNTTSFTTKGAEKDEDRSSSPAFASDDDNSSSGGAVGASKSPPALSSGIYIGRPNPSAGIVNSALFANTGGLVRSLHGDLFFGPVDSTEESQNLLQPPPPYSQVAPNKSAGYQDGLSDTDGPGLHANDVDDSVYSSNTDRHEKQTTPLLKDEINKGCRFIDEKSFMETLSSENSALLPVISHQASEVDESDDQAGGNLASSPIWKRRTSLPALSNDDYDIEDDMSDFITDFTTNTTMLTSCIANNKAADDYEDENDQTAGEADETTPAIKRRGVSGAVDENADEAGEDKKSNSISGGADTIGNHQPTPSGGSTAASNAMNANCNTTAHVSDTNEDSSRSDIHCLSAATGRRRNKDTRLHTLVKSVRSRNSRKRNRRERKSKSENRARKALRTITIILGAFVLCWTPYHIIVMVMALCKDCVPSSLYAFSYWMCYLNSPINPFCYAFANAQFKRTFIRIIRFDWHRT